MSARVLPKRCESFFSRLIYLQTSAYIAAIRSQSPQSQYHCLIYGTCLPHMIHARYATRQVTSSDSQACGGELIVRLRAILVSLTE